MTARQAQEKGFVDEVVSVNDAKAFKMNLQNVAVLNCLRGYENVPTELLKNASDTPGEVEDSETGSADADGSELNNDSKCEESDLSEASTDQTLIETEEVAGTDVEGGLELHVEEEGIDQPVNDQVYDNARRIRELRDYLDIFGPKR